MTPSGSGASRSAAPAGPAGRLAAAIVVSLALHGAVLHSVSRLPRGWQAGDWSPSHAGTSALHATLRAAAPGIESNQPEALLAPSQPPAEPPAPDAPEAPKATEATEQPPAAVAESGRSGDDPTPRQPLAEEGSADAQSAGVLAAPVYYPASQLDQRPLIKVHVEPKFPPGAPVPTGRVVLRLYIGLDGAVDEIAIIAAEPPGVFEKAAVEAFAVARFTPGVKNGAQVRSLTTIEVFFGAPVPLGPARR